MRGRAWAKNGEWVSLNFRFALRADFGQWPANEKFSLFASVRRERSYIRASDAADNTASMF